MLLQPNIGMDDNNETTTQQAAARKEFARPTKKRQQQGMVVWSTDRNRQFDRGRSRINSLLFWKEKCLPAVCTVLLVFPLYFVYFLLCIFSRLVRKFAETDTKGDRRAIGVLMRGLLH